MKSPKQNEILLTSFKEEKLFSKCQTNHYLEIEKPIPYQSIQGMLNTNK